MMNMIIDDHTGQSKGAPKKILFETLADLQAAMHEDKNSNIHNETVGRFRWNFDGTSSICCLADTLEARILSQHYAQIAQEKINFLALNNKLSVPKNYEVPITFYTPLSARNLTVYDKKDQIQDVTAAQKIYTDSKSRAKHYKENNYIFLLALDPKQLSTALNEKISGTPLFLHMINSGNSYLVETLIKQINLHFPNQNNPIVLPPTLDINDDNVLNQIVSLVKNGHLEVMKTYLTNEKLKKPGNEVALIHLMTIAVKNGRTNVFNYLRDFIPASKYSSEYFLLKAVKKRQLTAFPFLLKEAKQPLSPSLMFEAIQLGDIHTMELLNNNGLAYAQTDANNVTSLHIAAISGKTRMIKFLLENSKISINVKDKNGATPLHYAARAGLGNTITYLCDNKADINTVDNKLQTPLHYAVIHQSNFDTIKKLLDKNADLNYINKDGTKPLELITDTILGKKISDYQIITGLGTKFSKLIADKNDDFAGLIKKSIDQFSKNLLNLTTEIDTNHLKISESIEEMLVLIILYDRQFPSSLKNADLKELYSSIGNLDRSSYPIKHGLLPFTRSAYNPSATFTPTTVTHEDQDKAINSVKTREGNIVIDKEVIAFLKQPVSSKKMLDTTKD